MGNYRRSQLEALVRNTIVLVGAPVAHNPLQRTFPKVLGGYIPIPSEAPFFFLQNEPGVLVTNWAPQVPYRAAKHDTFLPLSASRTESRTTVVEGLGQGTLSAEGGVRGCSVPGGCHTGLCVPPPVEG